jgi:hypothetical protein
MYDGSLWIERSSTLAAAAHGVVVLRHAHEHEEHQHSADPAGHYA